MATTGRLTPDTDIDVAAWKDENGNHSNLFSHADREVPDSGEYVTSDRLPKRRRNVVYVMTDDERFDWVRGVNYRQINTRLPLKTRMINNGILFTTMFGNLNSCAPSRGACMSGQAWWNSGLNNETNIELYDWTKHWWKDAYGTPTNRLTQTCHIGKVVNTWGSPTGDAPLPDVFTSMTPAFDEFYGFYNDGNGHNEQSKRSYASYEVQFDAQGNALPGYPTTFVAAYNKNDPTTYDEYATDYMRVRAVRFLENACNRDVDDPRHDLPFFLTISAIAGHTPFQTPPTYTPDTTNRAGRINQYGDPSGSGDVSGQGWIRDLYDTRMAGSDQGCTPPASGFTRTTGHVSTIAWNGVTYPCVVDTGSSPNWTQDQWVGGKLTMGSSFGTVIHNTPNTIVVGEWLAVGSGNTAWSYSLGSAPSDGSYTWTMADQDINQTNTGTPGGGSSDNTTNLQGASGPFSTSPGGNLLDERRTGQEMVAVDDMVEAICAYLEGRAGQYSLDNTVIIYAADNGLIRGEKDVWLDKGFPQFSNFKVPLIVRGPEISAGIENSTPICSWDINPTCLSFLGIPAGRLVYDGVTNGTTTLTSATANFTSADQGAKILGASVPDGTTISSVSNSTTVILNHTVPASTGKIVSIGGMRSRIVDGRDLSRALQGKEAFPVDRAIFFNCARPSVSGAWGVVTSQWRYYHTASPPGTVPGDAIFNWRRDPLELRNLFGDPEVAAIGTGQNPASSIQAELIALALANNGSAGHNPQAGYVPTVTYTK